MLNRILMVFLALLILAGCIQKSEDIHVLVAKPFDYELYLYTEPDQEESSQNYLSALLDWKMSQDEKQELEFKQTKTSSDDLDIPKDNLPLLVVKEKGKTLTSIAGENPRQEIINVLEESITFAN